MTRPTQWKDKSGHYRARAERAADVHGQECQTMAAMRSSRTRFSLPSTQKKRASSSRSRTTRPPATTTSSGWLSATGINARRSSSIRRTVNCRRCTPDAKSRGRGRIRALFPRAMATAPGVRDRPDLKILPLGERCISFGAPRTGAGYNSYLQIFQSPNAVVAAAGDGPRCADRATGNSEHHLNADVRQWLGDSRGHWEGDTLVVETTNYRDGFMGSTPDVQGDRTVHPSQR